MTDGICRELPWDSQHFGMAIGTVSRPPLAEADMDAVDAWAAEHRIRCLYLLCPAGCLPGVRLASARGFLFVDLRETLSLDVPAASGEGATVRHAEAKDVPHLQAIAVSAHVDSRFFRDGGFPRDRCEALYTKWIERSMAKSAAVLVVDDDLGPAGYVTCDRDGEDWWIGLFAIAERSRGRGVGRGLLKSAVQWMAEQGAARVRVVTQGHNVAALRLYQHAGFRTCGAELWYHKWY